MKKTISITLAGRIFTVEDDGYRVLEAYLNGLKRHFAQDESADELMNDIESSIAEKFLEKLGPNKQAVTIDDVNDVISVMGKLEEITDEEASSSDTSDKASEPKSEAPAHKRLYRDTEDIVIAGVCSGLAAYFGISATAMRIIFIVLGFLNGFGILLYLILWVAVPAAETTAQKFEMRGKPVNVDEIEQVVKEKAKKMGEEGKAAFERLKMENTSVINRILNILVVIIGAVFKALRAFFLVLGPLVSIGVGIFLMLGSMFGVTAASVLASMLLFPSHSTYLVSDLPISELVGQPLYYVGVIGAYVLALVPLILLITLSATLIRRKNSFRLVPVSVLVGLWILSACATAVAARDIGPWAYTRLQDIERQSTISRTYAETGFDRIVSYGDVNIHVVRGEAFGVSATGTTRAMDRLSVTQKDGVLTVSTRGENRGPCFFCITRRVEAEVTLPVLASYTSKDISHVTIDDFKNDIVLSVEDASRVEMPLSWQNVTSTVQDVGRLSLSGTSKHFVANVSDASRLEWEKLEADSIRLTQGDVSRVYLSGTATELFAHLKDASRLDAEDLQVTHVETTTKDVSRIVLPMATSTEEME